MIGVSTEYIFLLPFVVYIACTTATATAYFQWDIGSRRVRLSQRMRAACIGPAVLSICAGLAVSILWYVHIRPLIPEYSEGRFVLGACWDTLPFSIVGYLVFDTLVRHVLEPGFVRYRTRSAREPR
jgi:hypothetical protein